MNETTTPFRVYMVGEDDWYAARSPSEALACARETTLNRYEDEDADIVHLMTDEEMHRYIYHADDRTHRTFAAQLALMVAAGLSEPVYFASSEF